MTNPAFLEFVHLIVAGDLDAVTRRLVDDPALAAIASPTGATRQGASSFFFASIKHYMYAGDTALHMAAAAFHRSIAEVLVAHGASCRATNRRKAAPLHYACDANRWDPEAQAGTIEYLMSVGADPGAVDMDGTAPLHRAVRTRSLAAVRALLGAGADPRQKNKNGSTPLHLAVQPTGRGGSGLAAARDQQPAIIRLLLERGATPDDRDRHGNDVYAVATRSASQWIQRL